MFFLAFVLAFALQTSPNAADQTVDQITALLRTKDQALLDAIAPGCLLYTSSSDLWKTLWKIRPPRLQGLFFQPLT